MVGLVTNNGRRKVPLESEMPAPTGSGMPASEDFLRPDQIAAIQVGLSATAEPFGDGFSRALPSRQILSMIQRPGTRNRRWS